MIEREPGRQMPRPARFVVAIIFFLIALCLSVLVFNTAATVAIVELNKKEIQATVTQKEIARGKAGTSYYCAYAFEVENAHYRRPGFFGLFTSKTRINKPEYDAVETGSTMTVFYSERFPQFNVPQNDPYKYDKFFFVIAGIFLFGLMALNEFKAFFREKKK